MGGADIQEDVQGTSLAPVFDSPEAPGSALLAKPAFSQIGSCACKTYTVNGWTGKECDAGRCFKTPVDEFDYMGYSMRTADGWRFTAWVPMDNATSRVDWTKPVEHELYDLRTDPGSDFDFDGYSENVASQHPEMVEAMAKELQKAVGTWY